MRKKQYSAGILILMAVLLFWGAVRQNGQKSYGTKPALGKDKNFISNAVTKICKSDYIEEVVSEIETDIQLQSHYGTYRITEFYPASSDTWRNAASELNVTNGITGQESDLFLGRIVQIKPEMLMVYDMDHGYPDRIEKYEEKDLQYSFMGNESYANKYLIHSFASYIQDEFGTSDGEGILVAEGSRTYYFLGFDNKDKMVMIFKSGGLLLERSE